MEITDALRAAVRAAECERLGGHDIDTSAAFAWSAAYSAQSVPSQASQAVQNLDDTAEQLPHLTCRRCGRVWLVVPLEGTDYDDAERALYGVLQGGSDLARRIVRTRTARQRRAADTARGEGDPG